MNPKPSVLVVDDEPLLRDLMTEWLTFEGYCVLTAENGIDALRVLEASSVGAIVTDIRMPKMDGIALLKRLKQLPVPLPSVVFITGFADMSLREAYDLGAEALIPKPFTPDQLVNAVRRMFTPREELWRSGSQPPLEPALQSNFSTVEASRAAGQLAFGRGGFCIQTAGLGRQGAVRFDLNFKDEPFRLLGHGFIRWVSIPEAELGVEIEGLNDDCLKRGIDLTVRGHAKSYIPATAKTEGEW